MSRSIILPPDSPQLADGSKPGGWWHVADDGERIVCDLCPRACALKPGDRGFCFVRENRDGAMVLTTYGRSTGFCIDPIEKKPLNHFYPGTSVLSFGTAGCNLGCKFCQNWSISKSREVERASEFALPDAIVAAAIHHACHSVAFTYNDPIIWAEYAIDTARACRAAGIKTVAVTAGYITEIARKPFFAEMDAANIDLKAFTEDFYQHLTLSHLQPVLDTLAWVRRETNVWFEITNLVIPQANDSDDELRRLCDWVVEHLGDDVPVHFTAFHPDFRLKDRDRTPLETLLRGYKIAREIGIKFPYVGNVNDVRHQSTYCPACRNCVIVRDWYELGDYRLDGNRCTHCGATVAGHFAERPGNWGRKRVPIQMSNFVSARGQGGAINPTITSSSPKRQIHEQPKSGAAMVATAPQLNDEQKKLLHREACWLVACASQGYATRLLDPELGGTARASVLGCFVTLKRQGNLRACCGFVGRTTPLADALLEAAIATATRDMRLPTLSRIELRHLQVDLSLLHSLQPMTAIGESRRDVVEIGRHGLQIVMGNARGLLLPSVATENDLDAEEFLQHVCIKAGLPPTAWKSPEAQLATFEGLVFGGPFDRNLLGAWNLDSAPLLSAHEIQDLAAVCKSNILAFTSGGTPTYFAANCKDGTVNSISLIMRLPGYDAPSQFGKLSIRPGIPLQATLVELCRTAANLFRASGFTAQQLENMQVDVAVLHDPAMHGTIAEPDLAGLVSDERAILVLQQNRSCWIADTRLSVEMRLNEARMAAGITHPHQAQVFSFHAASTEWPVRQINVPQAARDTTPRRTAVAGTFYPSDATDMKREVASLFPAVPGRRAPWRGAMVPHAGWKYSGRVAAAVLDRIEIPSTVIVIGPKHTRQGVDWAVAPCDRWEIPGGTLNADLELSHAISTRIPQLQLDSVAHAQEHAIEVELPLIAHRAPHVKVVGIAIGPGELDDCRMIAEGLADVLRARSEMPLLLISSDMNHFATDEETRRLDELALTCLDRVDPETLYRVVRQNRISMCGMLPAVIVLETLQRLRPLQCAERVAYATSADTTGDTSRVVGYAGMLFD